MLLSLISPYTLSVPPLFARRNVRTLNPISVHVATLSSNTMGAPLQSFYPPSLYGVPTSVYPFQQPGAFPGPYAGGGGAGAGGAAGSTGTGAGSAGGAPFYGELCVTKTALEQTISRSFHVFTTAVAWRESVRTSTATFPGLDGADCCYLCRKPIRRPGRPFVILRRSISIFRVFS